MSKHTPGPWVAHRWFGSTPDSSHGSKIVQECLICDADGRKLAEVFAPEAVDVMAAAPQMLEALEAIVELAAEAYQHWDADREMKVGKILLALSGNLSGYHPRIDAIHAIIAKAKGEQP